MNFETVKKDSEAALKGVQLDIERRDGSVYAITLTDVDGAVLRLAASDYSGIRVLRPAKPKLVKRWFVVGDVRGLKVDEGFEQEHQAIERRSDLADIGNSETLQVVARDVPEGAS